MLRFLCRWGFHRDKPIAGTYDRRVAGKVADGIFNTMLFMDHVCTRCGRRCKRYMPWCDEMREITGR